MSDNKNIIPSSIPIVLSFIPFIGICFIIAGYIYFAIIFNHFNIQINQYLDLNEIITLFLPRLLYLIFILFLPFVLDIIFPPFVDKDSDAENNDGIMNLKTLITLIIEEIKSLYKSNKGYFVSHLLIVLLDILYFILSFFFTIREERLYSLLAFNILLFGPILLSLLLKRINTNYQRIFGKKLNHYFSFIIYYFCFFLLMTVAISYVEISSLYTPKTEKISFHYNNSPLTTATDQILFIGQTRSYLFLYNKSTKTTHVYERNNIKNFTIEDSKSYSPNFHRYHPLFYNK